MVCHGVLTPAWHQAHQRSCVASADSTGVNWPAEYWTAEIEWSDETLWNWRNEIEVVGSAEPGVHMAKMKLFVRRERPALGRSSCSVASLALRWCRSRGWWLARGGWLGLGFVLLGVVAGPAPDAAAQANTRQVDAQVNLPYAVQFGFGSYDVGGLSVNVFRVPVKHKFALGPEEDAWRLVLTGYLGYGHFSFETSVLGPKITASEDFAFVLPQAELQIPLRRWWTVKPYVAAGLGRTFNASTAIEGPPGGIARRRRFCLPVRGWDQQPLRVPGAGLPPQRRHQAGGGWGCRTVHEHELRDAPERPGSSSTAGVSCDGP